MTIATGYHSLGYVSKFVAAMIEPLPAIVPAIKEGKLPFCIKDKHFA